MSLNLGKRKRENQNSPRKSRKLPQTKHKEQEQEDNEEDNPSGSEISFDNELDQNDIDQPSQTQPHAHSGSSVLPTGEQIKVMKDANELFRSSSFKLQIDALLPNVKPKYSKSQPLDNFLMSLHSFLGKVSSIPPSHPLSAAKKLQKKGVCVMYGDPPPTEDTKWTVAFEKPSEITLVGSWANKIAIKGKDASKFGVDLAVEMPSNLFQEKDYLDGRFFHKRAFYLAVLARLIKDKKNGLPDVDVSYDCPSGDIRHSRLVIRSTSQDPSKNFTESLHAQVNIIPVLPDNSPIPHSRLSPAHSNLRDPDSQEHYSSPQYNNAILTCTNSFVKSDLLTAYEDKQSCPAFEYALALLRIWANQRGYTRCSQNAIQGFEAKGPFWNALLHFLLVGDPSPKSGSDVRRPLGRGLSSYQLFRGALDFLAKHNFAKYPIFIKCREGTHKFPPNDYLSLLEEGVPVFVDPSSNVNLLSGTSLGSLDLLKGDARQTLESLNESLPGTSHDPFKEVFLTDQRSLATRFDVMLCVDLSSAQARTPLSPGTILDSASSFHALLSSISDLLRRGLGNRTRAVVFIQPSPSSFSVTHSSLPAPPRIVHIGLILDTEHAFHLVDHGPAADDPDPANAENFRSLWGKNAELRRFKDGRIIESVVWDVKTAEERMHVPALIVKHLLGLHFNIPSDAISSHQENFDKLIKLPEALSAKISNHGGDVKPGFKSALAGFDKLVKTIKNLGDELPLSLVTVSPVSSSLRYTSIFTPAPLPASLLSRLPPTARYLPELEVIIEFEKSSKWPDNLKAIQKIKLAFFETIASGLMKSVEGLQAHVVVGDGMTDSEIVDQGRLVVVMPEGWAFSARIWHDREATLLDRILDDKAKAKKFPAFKEMHKGGTHELHGAQEVDQAKEVYVRRFVHAPRHHRAIATLSHQYSAYAGTVRLMKRWFASHWLLDGHVSGEAVEILCAQFFVSNKPIAQDQPHHYDPRIPGSKERGFALVIEFLMGWKWEEDDMFIPLYSHSTVPSQTATLPTGLVKHGVWRIGTETDKEGKMWTSDFPQVVSANRIRSLAQATWKCISSIGSENFNPKTMFTHPTEDYDIILDLELSVLPRYAQNLSPDLSLLTKSPFVNASSTSAEVLPGFDPARMLADDLQRIYDGTLKVFYDYCGGSKVGAIWDPSLSKSRPFRVLGGFSPMPASQNGKEKTKDQNVVLNRDGVVREIQRMGDGLVVRIVAQ